MPTDDFRIRSLVLTSLFLLMLAEPSLQDPLPISLHNHNGRGDIVQLWPASGEYSSRPGVMRNALKPNAPNRWIHYRDRRGKFIIPYVITGKFAESEHRIIHGAMRAIRKNSCVRFRKRRNEADFVSIENQRGEGCYTMVGRARGKNVVMLETNEYATCLLHETVIHELFHTIGLWHEQMRYDRDDYITVHYENIPPSFYVQFKKIPPFQSTTYNVKYDYTSVMHYGKDAFATVPGEITMETTDKNAQEVIGNARDASPSDYIKCMGQPFQMGESVAYKKVVDEKTGDAGLPLPVHPSIGLTTGKNGNIGDIGGGISKRISELFNRLSGQFRQPVHILDHGQAVPQVDTAPSSAENSHESRIVDSGSSDSTDSESSSQLSESSPSDEQRLPLSEFLLTSAPHNFDFHSSNEKDNASSEWLQLSDDADDAGSSSRGTK